MFWTAQFLSQKRSLMTLGSAWRYRDYLLRSRKQKEGSGGLLRLKLKRCGEVLLREYSSDCSTFAEVIEQEAYRDVKDYPEAKTIIDLGANIGLASLYMAQQCAGSRIFAVEPHLGNFQLLTHNLGSLISAQRCQLLQAAVWSEAQMLDMTSDWAEHFSTYQVSGSGSSVLGLTMGEIIARSGFERIDVLKVDIEGAEVQLFSGDTSWLARVGMLMIEFHSDAREQIGFDALIARHGLRILKDSGSHTLTAGRE